MPSPIPFPAGPLPLTLSAALFAIPGVFGVAAALNSHEPFSQGAGTATGAGAPAGARGDDARGDDARGDDARGGDVAASRPAKVTGDLRAAGEERHFSKITQITYGGQNAEAYFSADDKKLIFQSTREKYVCDQIFTMSVDGSDVKLVSTGTGKTTCAYYYPSGDRVLWASIHMAGPDCPPRPDYSKGYVWRVEETFDIYTSKPDGTDVKPLVAQPGYDAEATISRDGSRIVFTSDRDGDLELYSMNANGGDIRRLTNSPGYDGGAFFSFDGKKIIFRARRSNDPKEIEENKNLLLKEHLVRPSKMDIFVMDADGTNQKQVTNLNAAAFAPFMHPDGKRIIFSTNHADPKGRDFDLFIIQTDGTGLEAVTKSPDFDGFPMWTSDGTKLAFSSNRNGKVPRETNVFIADWKD